MDQKSRKYLTKATEPGGFTDKSGDWVTCDGLAKKGLVTVTEIMVATKGVGAHPAPHIVATDEGKIVAKALS